MLCYGSLEQTVAELQLSNLTGAIKLLKSAFEGLQIAIGQQLTPVLTEMALKVADSMRAITRFTKAHPELIKNVTLLVAKLGLLSLGLGLAMLAFSPLANVIYSMTSALHVMAMKTAEANRMMTFWAGSAKAQQLYLTASAGVITAVYIGAILALVVIIKEVLDLYNDWQTAIEVNKEAQEKASKAILFNYKAVEKQLYDLRNTYSDLTDYEEKQIKVIEEEIKAQQDRIAVAEKNGTLDEKMIESGQKIIIALKQRTKAIEDEIESTERSTYAQDRVLKQDEYAEKAKRRLADAVAPLIEEYIKLTEQFNRNEIGAEAYLEAFDRITKGMQGAGMKVDEVAKKLAELDQKHFKVEVDLEVTGQEELRDAERDIARLQGEYALLVTKDEDAKNRLQRMLALKEDLADVEDRRIDLEEAYQEIDKKGIELQKEKIEAIKQKYQDENILRTTEGQKELERINKEVDKFKEGERAKLEALKLNLSEQETYIKAIFLEQEKAVQSLANATAEAQQDSRDEIEQTVRSLGTLKSAYDDVGIATRSQMDGQGFSVPSINMPSGLQGVTSGLSGLDEGLKGLGDTIKEVDDKIEKTLGDASTTVGRALETLVSGGNGGSYFSGDRTGTATLRSGQGGIPFVPRTGSYRLHKGETVLSQDKATQGEITIVNVIDEKMIPQIMAKYPNAIINPMLNSMMTNPVVKKVMRSTLR